MSSFPYTVKVSSRAKNPRLKMTPHNGLVVVLPEGFNKKHLPALLDRHDEWIKKTAQKIDSHRPDPLPLTENGLPYTIAFSHLNEEWSVEYNNTGRRAVEVDEASGKRLLLSADVADRELCRRQLLSWLKKEARKQLIPSLEKIAAAHDFRYAEALVRLQHSRWGSCSSPSPDNLEHKTAFFFRII